MSPEESAPSGVLESIESFQQVPGRLLESILEGLSKEPSKWIVMGLGFYVGWQGYDVIEYFMKALGSKEGKAITNAYVDVQKLAFTPMVYVELYDALKGIVPKKRQPQTAEEAATDPTKSELEQKVSSAKKEIEGRLLMGALGALTAAILTTPGTVPGIIQGIGEIVPG